MYESLFQIESYTIIENLLGKSPKLIINSNPTDYQLDSLSCLGYNNDNLIKCSGNRTIVNQLVVPSMRRVKFDLNEIIFPSAIKWLRRAVFSYLENYSPNEEFNQRLFISRQDTYGRKIINMDEVNNMLVKHDFSIYCLEKMSFFDQVSLFKNAKSIIGAHGAGLANIIFSSNANVLEIFGKTPDHYSEYFRLSNMLKLNYAYMFTDYDSSNYKNSNIKNYDENDLIIDINRFRTYINRLIN